MTEESIEVERRGDGAIIVRVRSSEQDGDRLPDAVFSFRLGDPQFGLWEKRLQAQAVGA